MGESAADFIQRKKSQWAQEPALIRTTCALTKAGGVREAPRLIRYPQRLGVGPPPHLRVTLL